MGPEGMAREGKLPDGVPACHWSVLAVVVASIGARFSAAGSGQWCRADAVALYRSLLGHVSQGRADRHGSDQFRFSQSSMFLCKKKIYFPFLFFILFYFPPRREPGSVCNVGLGRGLVPKPLVRTTSTVQRPRAPPAGIPDAAPEGKGRPSQASQAKHATWDGVITSRLPQVSARRLRRR